jgi:diadenosine tetraphosphate (Ap4A) HIT family hydrolase
MEGCFACEVNTGRVAAPGGVIYEDGQWIAEHGVDPLVRGYVVLKPKRHVEWMADLSATEAASLGGALKTLLNAMRAALAPERVYVCAFGETVRHVHLHLIPRYRDMPGLGPNLMTDLFARRWECSISEAEAAADVIRAALSGFARR